MSMLKLATKLLVAFAIAAVQVTPSFAAPVSKKPKYETRTAVVLVSQIRFEQIKKQRKDLASAFASAAERGTKVRVSYKDAHWLMAQSRDTHREMSGASAAALAAAIPLIIVAIPIVYKAITNRDLDQDFPAFKPLVCLASIFYQPLQAACAAPVATAPRDKVVEAQPTSWWVRWLYPAPR